MKIAILGWGSLIWSPRELKYDKNFGWKNEGPLLPLEYARISNNGRLTLVISDEGTNVVTYYTLSKLQSISDVVLNLANRENTKINGIGYYDRKNDIFSDNNFKHKVIIKEWIDKSDFDAIVWTNLGEKWSFKNLDGKLIKVEPHERIMYLESLKGEKRKNAEEYIINTPVQIKTHFRKLIEEKLKWLPK